MPHKAQAKNQHITEVLAYKDMIFQKQLEKLALLLQKHHFAATVLPNLEAAKNYILDDLLPESGAKTVSFGGSFSLVQAGFPDVLLQSSKYKVLNTYDFSLPMEQIIETRRQSLLVDFYLSSANAITEKGEIVLLDGTGNRTAAVQFGPHNVVLLLGRNKLCINLEDAMQRTRQFAAPVNAARLKRGTPCCHTGFCADCASPERICNTWTILERCRPEGRIHVLLVNEELGF